MRNIDDGEKKETIGASQPPGRQPTATPTLVSICVRYQVSAIKNRILLLDIKYHLFSIRYRILEIENPISSIRKHIFSVRYNVSDIRH